MKRVKRNPAELKIHEMIELVTGHRGRGSALRDIRIVQKKSHKERMVAATNFNSSQTISCLIGNFEDKKRRLSPKQRAVI